jgi:hypothetical protein
MMHINIWARTDANRYTLFHAVCALRSNEASSLRSPGSLYGWQQFTIGDNALQAHRAHKRHAWASSHRSVKSRESTKSPYSLVFEQTRCFKSERRLSSSPNTCMSEVRLGPRCRCISTFPLCPSLSTPQRSKSVAPETYDRGLNSVLPVP